MSDGVEWADVGERVRVARLAAGLTQEELGARAGLDRTMIVKIESGNRRIDAMELIRLSSALQVPVDFLLRSTPLVLSHRASVMAKMLIPKWQGSPDAWTWLWWPGCMTCSRWSS